MSYSLNVPVPGELKRLAGELYPRLVAFDRVRERHTLVCKRLTDGEGSGGSGGRGGSDSPARLRERLRRELADAPPIELRVAGIDAFEAPTQGSGPVVYLAIESPELVSLHRRLCESFPPVEGIEGDDYVPHVTLARGGSPADAERLRSLDVEPFGWSAAELVLWSAEYREPVTRFGLSG